MIIAGILLFIRRPRFELNLKRGKVYGLAGPVLVLLGILMLTGIIPGIG